MKLLIVGFVCFFSFYAPIWSQGRYERVELLWEDHFDGENPHFISSESDDLIGVVANGSYMLSHKTHKYYHTKYHQVNINPGQDFLIRSKIRFTEGEDDAYYGLVWGYKDVDNHFDFVIGKDGFFRILKEKNGVQLIPKNWSRSNAIRPNGKWNEIEIRKTGFKYEFTINNEQVYVSSYWPLYGNNIGYKIKNVCTIESDYLVVEQPRSVHVASKTISPYKKQNLGKPVNTKYSEVSCLVAHDGKLLVLNRDNHPGNRYPSSENDDVWFSEWKNSEWGTPVNIGSPINNAGNNYIVSISPDRNTLIISNIYNDDGTSGGNGYSISHWTGSKWQLPKSIQIEEYVNDGEYGGAALSPDGNVVILTLQDKDSKGVNDLYVSFVQSDESWSKPLNLGGIVNGFDHEYSPFLAADGTSLYFASQSHPGYGGADIFVSKRLDDTWLKWSEPLNLGRSVNTVGWDGNFSVEASGERAFLTSYSNSLGSGDIFSIRLKEEMKPDPVVILSGRVLDSKSGRPVEASITYRELESDRDLGHALSDPKTGKYRIVLTEGREYGFYAKNDKYISLRYHMDFNEIGAYKEIEQDLFLAPVELNAKVVLNNVFFEPNKSNLLGKSEPELDKLVALMAGSKTMEIEILGHTNPSKATEKFHRELSQRRADRVRDYVIQKGIDENRVTATGCGYNNPINLGVADSHKMQNMRVEFRITKK